MTLAAGTRLGPYEIQSVIGAGGMGEVYRARDTRLGRTVAIKILAPHAAADQERRRRFEQEARAASALNHPHICVLHDIGSQDGIDYLVMEHLDGQTLAERLSKGALPVAQAVEYAIQVADALAQAHREGIIHRDLKPGNVMLARSGAKVLDFGLARLTRDSHLSGASITLTASAAIVGTVPYMAPEQVQGQTTDARTDLFAFGAVLYEMLTGRRAFAGATPSTVAAAILEHEPAPVATIQPSTPPALAHLVRQCLAKTPDDRPDTAHDVASQLRWIRDASGQSAAALAPPRRSWGAASVLLTGAAILLILAAGAGATWLLQRPAVRQSAGGLHLNLALDPAEGIDAGGYSFSLTPGGSTRALAWTPDGRSLVFVGRRAGVQQLYVRRIDAAEARAIPGTEGAEVPAVSSDGQTIAFWAANAIKKVRFDGTDLTDLVPDAPCPPAMVWDDAARLLFSYRPSGEAQARIGAVSAGRPPMALTKMRADEAHAYPWPLPGGRAILYTVFTSSSPSWKDMQVVAETLATGERTPLLKDAVDARYLPTGHLIFLRRGTLFGVAFDAERLQTRGEPQPLLSAVAQALTGGSTADETGAGQFDVSANGMLAWVRSDVVPYPNATVVAVDRRGNVTPLQAPSRAYTGYVRISPDGRQLALTERTPNGQNVLVYDVGRTTLTVLAREAWGGTVLWWPPDGQRLVFQRLAGGSQRVWMQAADGSAPVRPLLSERLAPVSFTPDGRKLLGNRAGNIAVVNVEGAEGRVESEAQTPEREYGAEVSPDGRWIAFASDASGRDEVYVRPYPGPGPVLPLSATGGGAAAWSRSGRELFYISTMREPGGKRAMMAVDVEPNGVPGFGRARMLFEFDNRDLGFACAPARCYDVTPDGRQFYVTRTPQLVRPPMARHLDIVPDWVEQLKATVPAR